MGDNSPVTKSPGKPFDKEVLKVIAHKHQTYSSDYEGELEITSSDYGRSGGYDQGLGQTFKTATVQGAYQTFNYEVTPEGIRVIDDFNFEDPNIPSSTTIGAFGGIPIIGPIGQTIATNLVRIGDLRARLA